MSKKLQGCLVGIVMCLSGLILVQVQVMYYYISPESITQFTADRLVFLLTAGVALISIFNTLVTSFLFWIFTEKLILWKLFREDSSLGFDYLIILARRAREAFQQEDSFQPRIIPDEAPNYDELTERNRVDRARLSEKSKKGKEHFWCVCRIFQARHLIMGSQYPSRVTIKWFSDQKLSGINPASDAH